MSKKIVVIGAGFAGLTTSCILAQKGYQVTVLEKNSWAGGRAQVWQKDGYKFDMGPSWYLMPEVFENFFALFGKKPADYYKLEKLELGYTIFLDEGKRYEIPTGLENAVNFFENIEQGSGVKLRKYLEKAKYKYNFAMKKFVYKDFDSLLDFVDLDLFKVLFGSDIFISLEKIIYRDFKNPLLRKILGYPAVFLGGFPNRIPGVYSLLNWVDFGLSAWHPEGGFGKVAESFYKLALELGVKFEFEAEVKSVRITEAKIDQVSCKNGQTYDLDMLINNADYAWFEQNILPPEYRYYSEDFWQKADLSNSCLNFYLGLDTKVEKLTHHSFFFDSDWDAHGNSVYGSGGGVFLPSDKQISWPSQPLFYIHMPSKTDPTTAPKNGETMFILIPIASGLDGDDEQTRQKYLNYALDKIEKFTDQNLREHIQIQKDYCISDFQKDYNAFKGNAFGLGQTLFQTASFRPKNFSPKIANLFYTGQFTTPGTGVPMAVISGEIVARKVEKLDKKV